MESFYKDTKKFCIIVLIICCQTNDIFIISEAVFANSDYFDTYADSEVVYLLRYSDVVH